MAEPIPIEPGLGQSSAAAKTPLRYVAWVPGGRFGGCEAYALAVAAYARDHGWDVTLLCAHRACAEECRQREPGIRTILLARPAILQALPGREKLFRLWEAFRSYLYLLRHRPGVVHAVLPWHVHSIGFIQSCTWLRQPALVTFQLVAAGSPPPRQYFEVFRRARKAGVTYCAISDNNRRLLASYYGFDSAEMAVIPNRPVRRPPPILPPGRREAIRSSLGVPKDGWMIFTAAHLHRQKGHDLILRAMPTILTRYPQVVFVWAGEGEERLRLEALVQSEGLAGAIRLLGWREDVPDLLAASDLFLFPTRFEGESFALMEAMAAQVPIVASAVSGIPELLRDGTDARLFAAEDVAGLAAAVIATLANPDEAASRAAQASRRLAAYTHEHMLEDTLSLLRNVANPATRRET